MNNILKNIFCSCFTYPVLEGENVGRAALVEDNVEDDHNQHRQVEARNGCYWMEVSFKCDEHPRGKYQNPRYAAQGNSN